MKLTATYTITKTVSKSLHALPVDKGIEAVEAMLNEYVEHDFEKYLTFLGKLKKLTDACHRGHGLG